MARFLDFDEFSSDRDAVMARASKVGITAYLTIGIRVRDFARVRAFMQHVGDAVAARLAQAEGAS